MKYETYTTRNIFNSKRPKFNKELAYKLTYKLKN